MTQEVQVTIKLDMPANLSNTEIRDIVYQMEAAWKRIHHPVGPSPLFMSILSVKQEAEIYGNT
jgi:hypothetical protein